MADLIDLNQLENMHGPLDGEMRVRLVAAARNPTQETWSDAYTIILRSGTGWGMGLTLWQAVLAVDPTFTMSKGSDETWPKVPSTETIERALRFATTAEPPRC